MPDDALLDRAADRIALLLICPACLRLRISPVHLLLRRAGVCRGQRE